MTASGSSAVVKNSTVEINYIAAENGGRLELGGGSYIGLTVKNDGSSASLSGGTYKKIEWGNSYVPAKEYLADGLNDPTQFEQPLVVVQNGWGHFMPELLALQGVQAFLYFMSCVT